jgi:hypothetical protein
LDNPTERRKRIHSTLIEFGQIHQLLTSTDENEKPHDALTKNMINEKVIDKFTFSLHSFIEF